MKRKLLCLLFSLAIFFTATATTYASSISSITDTASSSILAPREQSDPWHYCGVVQYSDKFVNVTTSLIIAAISGNVPKFAKSALQTVATAILIQAGSKNVTITYKVYRYSLFVDSSVSGNDYYKLQEVMHVYANGKFIDVLSTEWKTPYPPSWAK